MVSSRLSSFAAAPHLATQGSPYPEVTDALLPSSLTPDDPFAWVYSTTPPVLVCGTVSYDSRLRRFSWKQKGTDSAALRRVIAFRARLNRGICLPVSMPCALDVRSIRTLRSSHSVTPHLHRRNPVSLTCSPKGTEAGKTIKLRHWSIHMKYGNINPLSIGYAFRPGLRTD